MSTSMPICCPAVSYHIMMDAWSGDTGWGDKEEEEEGLASECDEEDSNFPAPLINTPMTPALSHSETHTHTLGRHTSCRGIHKFAGRHMKKQADTEIIRQPHTHTHAHTHKHTEANAGTHACAARTHTSSLSFSPSVSPCKSQKMECRFYLNLVHPSHCFLLTIIARAHCFVINTPN